MAVIGSIRKRSGLLVGLIGLSIVGFLIMDATNSQFSVLRGRKDYVGKVNGEKINYLDFQKKLEENNKNYEDRSGKKTGLTDEEHNFIRQNTWDDFVNDIIFSKINDKNGIQVTDDEMVELMSGQNPHAFVRQSFTNPQTGQFDPNQVKFYVQNVDKDEKGQEPGTKRRIWENFMKEVKKDQLKQKYSNLVSKGLYVPTWMGKMAYEDQNRLVDFRFVALPYSEINDNDVKMTDDDMKTYMKKNEEKFKQEDETRKIDYVTFDIIPSHQDSAATFAWLTDKKAEFEKQEKMSDDSLFVKLYSEQAFEDVYTTKDKMTSAIKDTLFEMPVKSIAGPYLDNGAFKLAKITDRKMISDSVHVREIIFSFENVKTQEEGKRKKDLWDSLFTAIDSLHADFAPLAAQYSDDMQSKVKGGDLGWVKQGTKDPFYNNQIFYRAKIGKTLKFATQTALHLVQVVEDKPSKMGVQVAYLTKSIIPSPETERSIYADAGKFLADNQTEAKFKEAGKKLNIRTVETLKKDEYSVMGLGNAREVVKWAYGAKKGDISGIIQADKKHVIALLDAIRAKGLPELDAVRDRVKFECMKEKKAEMLTKKVMDAKANTIDELASKLGKPANQADKASFMNPNLNGQGFEPNVAAAALRLAPNKLSAPIEGNAGVYVVQTIAVQEPAPSTDYTLGIQQLKGRVMGKAQRGTVEAQKKLATIEDDRTDFF